MHVGVMVVACLPMRGVGATIGNAIGLMAVSLVVPMVVVHPTLTTALALRGRCQGALFSKEREVVCPQVQEFCEVHLPLCGRQDWNKLVQFPDLCLHLGRLTEADQVHLIQNHLVCESNLPLGLIHSPVLNWQCQPGQAVLGVHHSDAAVATHALGDPRVLLEGLDDRHGVCHAAGLHQNKIDWVALRDLPLDGAKCLHQIGAHRATHAAAVEDHDLLRKLKLLTDQLLVDGDLAKLILKYRHPLLPLAGEDVIEQGGLPCTEEPREDDNRELGVLAEHSLPRILGH
mmetsp:Transcript_48398/g.86199  ORF Transcript_48398/g.86199 Transcript_48398/m.86199 type:complete len:287 (-) Transcript_48398:352-1212(-)